MKAWKFLVWVVVLTAIFLVVTTKGIGTCNSMMVKDFRSMAIMGHWYPIVCIDFHGHVMTGMMFLRQGYALVFGPFDASKHFQGMDC